MHPSSCGSTPGNNADVQVAANQNNVDSSSSGTKRKFSWFLHEWAGNQDELNKREDDGTLKPLTNYSSSFNEDLMTEPLIEIWKSMYEVNGKAFYDPEELALGSLNKSEYMLVPSNWEIEDCPIEAIGPGLNAYKVPNHTMSAVYALAKEQAKQLKFPKDDQVKWAVIRLEAFKSGWFARQKYTMFKPAPNGSTEIMLGDSKRIRELLRQACNLCFFLPFMTEYHFRAFGTAYNKGNSADYLSRAHNLAAAASLSECLTYMDRDNLHGKALAWIGVKRPMQVLRNRTAITRVPKPFQTRAYAAPSGQAIISTSIAVIDKIKAEGWWEDIKRQGGYDNSTLLSVGANVASNPWKFHPMHHVYGEEAPGGDEAGQVNEAKKSAIMFAPILQAYATTVMKDTSLGNIKALKKHADANRAMYLLACRFFQKISNKRATNKTQAFAADAFQLI